MGESRGLSSDTARLDVEIGLIILLPADVETDEATVDAAVDATDAAEDDAESAKLDTLAVLEYNSFSFGLILFSFWDFVACVRPLGCSDVGEKATI